jgi:hypothetical protein
MSWAVLDVDGVLADIRHRLNFVQSKPKNWDAFFNAAPRDGVLPEGLARSTELAVNHDIVYLTGRPERCRDDTLTWLSKHGFPGGELVMRPDTDRRPARVFKAAQLRRLSQRQDVAVVVDDDRAVVDVLLEDGYNVELATWMDESGPQQDSLFEAQEREGRT